jgi:hypothetical protein
MSIPCKRRGKAYRLRRTNIQTPTPFPIRTCTLIPEITHILNRRPIIIRGLPDIFAQSILKTYICRKPIISTTARRICAVCAAAHTRCAAVGDTWLVRCIGLAVSVWVVANRYYELWKDRYIRKKRNEIARRPHFGGDFLSYQELDLECIIQLKRQRLDVELRGTVHRRKEEKTRKIGNQEKMHRSEGNISSLNLEAAKDS